MPIVNPWNAMSGGSAQGPEGWHGMGNIEKLDGGEGGLPSCEPLPNLTADGLGVRYNAGRLSRRRPLLFGARIFAQRSVGSDGIDRTVPADRYRCKPVSVKVGVMPACFQVMG
jgi:hypothetical protein